MLEIIYPILFFLLDFDSSSSILYLFMVTDNEFELFDWARKLIFRGFVYFNLCVAEEDKVIKF